MLRVIEDSGLDVTGHREGRLGRLTDQLEVACIGRLKGATFIHRHGGP